MMIRVVVILVIVSLFVKPAKEYIEVVKKYNKLVKELE